MYVRSITFISHEDCTVPVKLYVHLYKQGILQITVELRGAGNVVAKTAVSLLHLYSVSFFEEIKRTVKKKIDLLF